MTDFKTKMAELAAKYNISHKRDIDWHNFVAEVEQLTHPELAEDEDERIRKRIRLCLDECVHSDIIRDYERDEVLAYLEKQKEQKPVQSDVEREYVRTLKSLISDFLRGKEDVDREYYQQIFDWLDGRHIEQKPVDFPTTDEEVNEFLETHSKVEVPEKYKTPDFVFSKQEYKSYPIISKDTTSVKPAEWSEEDEDMLNSCISSIEEAKENRYAYKETDGDTSYDHEIAWLKLLRNRVGKEFLQPHWKPSEQKYDGNMDKECIKLCDILNSITSIDTFESCCGHLKDRYSIWFFCNDIITISRLGRCVERNYSDGKWELLVDSTDTHPNGVFWLRSKVPFQSYDEMEKSVNELCNGIQHWFNTEFDPYFNSDSSHWKPSEEQMKALLNAEGYLQEGDQFDSAKSIAQLYEQLKKL